MTLPPPRGTGARRAIDPTAPFEVLVAEHLNDRDVVIELHVLLVRLGDVPPTFADRSAWLEALGSWLHGHSRSTLLLGGIDDEERTRRLRAFVLALASVERFRETFAALLTGVVSELRGTRLFADVGLPVEPGLWREAIDRVYRNGLPKPPKPKSFTDFIGHLFPHREDAQWLERCPSELWKRLWTILEATKSPPSTAWMPLAGSMADAVRILAVRIAALGVAQDIRDRLTDVPVAELPFLRLPQLCDSVQLGPPRMSTSNAGALDMVAECRQALGAIHSHLEQSGVSVDLVYRLELMSAQLARLEQLLVLLIPRDDSEVAGNVGRFVRSLVRAQHQGTSVFELAKTSSYLLARKIVERSGRSGEHYITQNGREWRSMLLSAAGGGFLTAFTAALKILTAGLALPVLWAGVANCVNYAGSFLLMGALGFTLATKQPSMTAAALAASLESEEAEAAGIDRLVTLIAQISRSQLAAAVGNVGMVIPTTLAFDFAWRKASGHAFVGPVKAEHIVESLQPFASGTVLFAALTGILLWLSSVGAGWLENWITYHRLPEAIAESRRLRRIFGMNRTKRFADALERSASSVGGSVTLGCLLGIVPMLGVLFGLPIDVRHVTLSTGSLVFAGTSLGSSVLHERAYLLAMLGIAIIGTLNFVVSFLSALAVALRASTRWNAQSTLTRDLWKALARRMLRNPLQFVLPPRTAPVASEVPPPETAE